MSRTRVQYMLCTLIIAYLGLTCANFANAQNNDCPNDSAVGKLVTIENSVKINTRVLREGDVINVSAQQGLNPDLNICSGDIISVPADSRATLYFSDAMKVVRLGERSIYQVKAASGSSVAQKTATDSQIADDEGFINYCKRKFQETVKDLTEGSMFINIFSSSPVRENVNTPYLNASVEGTQFFVRIQNEKTTVAVYSGKVRACNDNPSGETVLLENDEWVTAGKTDQLIKQRIIPPDAVQWALYYPVVGSGDVSTPLTQQAFEMLKVGQVEEAGQILYGSDSIPDAYNLALRSSVAVAQNRLQDALRWAKIAVDNYPDSTSAWVALSYAYQARFELEKALQSIETAHELDNADTLILARLAELQLSNDDKQAARKSAQQAVDTINQQEPNNSVKSRAHTVSGFMSLALIDIDEAMQSFKQAIESDQSNPLPRLGLGLSQIRKNKLENGLENIQIAATLDPSNSLIHSYLGKTYFENNQIDEALEEFHLAERLDSNDPTPNLYRAFLKQSINKPTQALRDLQHSIEDNDNRAVYRSRLGLDEDLATRSASTARIYEELGFDQLTILEGAKSLAHDPGNYSAHRLMADAYLNRPRHEIARVSELLQSQIRQPLNNNPAQVQLADSRLGAFRDSGPFDVSFNEFSRLYTQEGFTGRVGLVAGENSTHGEEVQISSLKGSTSFTLTGYNFETDGERLNADEDNELYNFFVQHQLTNRTSIQAEYRDIKIDRGETFIGFDREDFDPDLKINSDISSYRLGIAHYFDKDQELLINIKKEDFSEDFFNIDFGPVDQGVAFTEVDSSQYELQYSKSLTGSKLVAGVGNTKQDRSDEVVIEGVSLQDSDFDIDHFNSYLYLYPRLSHSKFGSFNFTAGFSYDDFDDVDIGREEFSPKFGLVWNNKNTTIRVAGFETLKRTLVGDQTLEPTNIAGFNQFYDDFDATNSRVYGIGVDQIKYFGSSEKDKLYFGAEYIKRELNVPGLIFNFEIEEFELKKEDISEDFLNIYAYKLYGNWSFGVFYEHEIFDRKEFFELREQILDLETNRVGLNFSYFHESGFKFTARPTYIDQDAELITRFFDEYSGADNFWIVDVSLGYRFNTKYINGLISFEVNNLFDKTFNYQDTNPFNSRYENDRAVYLTAGIQF